MSEIKLKSVLILIVINFICIVSTLESGGKSSVVNSYTVTRDDDNSEDVNAEIVPEEKVTYDLVPNLPPVQPIKVNIRTFDTKYRFVYKPRQIELPAENLKYSTKNKTTNSTIDSPDIDYDSYANNEVENPPPHEQVAKMARFVVKHSNWTSIATISTRTPIRGFPFANVFSVSDGPLDGNCTGIPYFYLTPLEISVQDLKIDSRASMTMSLAQGNYCRLHSYDPEDPRCAHVILTGFIRKVDNSSSEGAFAQEALFSRHPEMPDWPQDHGWFFAKMEIKNILVLDYFGGAKTVTPDQYFNVDDNFLTTN